VTAFVGHIRRDPLNEPVRVTSFTGSCAAGTTTAARSARGKADPRGFTMDSVRSRTAQRLKGGGGSKPAPDPKPSPKPSYEPFPGAAFFHVGQRSPIITAMGRRLVAEGCSRYEEGPSPDWSEADRRSYALWQQKQGFSGKDADGIPGKLTWDRLKVPKSK
jgi:hypothetical protein